MGTSANGERNLMNQRSSGLRNRRQFLAQAAAVGAAAATPYVITSPALGGADRPAASERITLGCIGHWATHPSSQKGTSP
jgi:hypothetical protein